MWRSCASRPYTCFKGAVDQSRRRYAGITRLRHPHLRLQRGRRSESTEMGRGCVDCGSHQTLQRGRRSESTEMRTTRTAVARRRSASKGPSIRVDGDARVTAPRARAHHDASKGPSIRVDGDAVHATAMQNGSRCFKGAVDQSRRRSTRSRPTVASFPSGFKGAVDQSRRRYPAHRPSIAAPGGCFKGAVDQSRRRCDVGLAPRVVAVASKGPSIRVDGDSPCDRCDHPGGRVLQRGRRSESTEMCRLHRVCGEIEELQRGRRSESTEIRRDARRVR